MELDPVQDHPPIPTKCAFFRRAFFRKAREEWIFDAWTTSNEPLGIRFGFAGFNFKSPWIQIVADVARLAWLDEAELLTGAERDVALTNALAWKKWPEECAKIK